MDVDVILHVPVLKAQHLWKQLRDVHHVSCDPNTIWNLVEKDLSVRLTPRVEVVPFDHASEGRPPMHNCGRNN